MHALRQKNVTPFFHHSVDAVVDRDPLPIHDQAAAVVRTQPESVGTVILDANPSVERDRPMIRPQRNVLKSQALAFSVLFGFQSGKIRKPVPVPFIIVLIHSIFFRIVTLKEHGDCGGVLTR